MIIMRWSKIDPFEYVNGTGIGVSLFVQGCHFHCKDCFNSETWDFSGGKPWTEDSKKIFLISVLRAYIERVSILGGEPLADENFSDVLDLVQTIHEKFPEKKIWIYTGYTWENLLNDSQKKEILPYINILVDGRFETDKKDLSLKFKGSSNQRVIDVQKSLENEEVVIFK
ncbi:anaerobic ribonucleotide reductase-activating protein [uncultured Clostridium sp.]|nr:anaerobic ribonucleotide reductase-activating protein [uncultured Clostridium sp.]